MVCSVGPTNEFNFSGAWECAWKSPMNDFSLCTSISPVRFFCWPRSNSYIGSNTWSSTVHRSHIHTHRQTYVIVCVCARARCFSQFPHSRRLSTSVNYITKHVSTAFLSFSLPPFWPQVLRSQPLGESWLIVRARETAKITIPIGKTAICNILQSRALANTINFYAAIVHGTERANDKNTHTFLCKMYGTFKSHFCSR